MFIELAEILVCPACRPRHGEGELQGLVAVVGELDGRKVLNGWLGCPACEARYRIRDGVVFFASEASDPSVRRPPASETPSGRSPQERDLPLLIAALLSLHEAAGYVLLGWGLGSLAEEISVLAPAAELVALTEREGTLASRPSARVNPLADAPRGSLPLRTASISAAAVMGAREDELAEAARVLKPAGRLAVLGSGPAGEEAVLSRLKAAGLEPLVVDPRAIIARRV